MTSFSVHLARGLQPGWDFVAFVHIYARDATKLPRKRYQAVSPRPLGHLFVIFGSYIWEWLKATYPLLSPDKIVDKFNDVVTASD